MTYGSDCSHRRLQCNWCLCCSQFFSTHPIVHVPTILINVCCNHACVLSHCFSPATNRWLRTVLYYHAPVVFRMRLWEGGRLWRIFTRRVAEFDEMLGLRGVWFRLSGCEKSGQSRRKTSLLSLGVRWSPYSHSTVGKSIQILEAPPKRKR